MNRHTRVTCKDIEDLVEVCVEKHKKLLSKRQRPTLCPQDLDTLVAKTEQLAPRLMRRMAVFGQHRAGTKDVRAMKRAKTTLTIEDVDLAWVTLQDQ